MTLLALFVFGGILTFVGARSTYYILKVIAGFSWILVMAYWIASPPSTIAVGSSVHTMGIVIFIGMAVACFFWVFWTTKLSNGQESGRWRLPFMQSEEEEELSAQQRRKLTRTERTDIYIARLNAALRGERRRR